MNEKAIRDAYARIRTIDQTIPDDVLDFMKDAAIEKLKQIDSGDANNYILKGNLEIALRFAIDHRQEEEKNMKYDFDSALVGGWKQNLASLINGEALKIK